MDDEATPSRTADPSVALAEALAERNRLWHEAQRAHALEHDLEQVRDELENLQSSFSWKVTAPLRGVKHRVGPRARRGLELAQLAQARLRG